LLPYLETERRAVVGKPPKEGDRNERHDGREKNGVEDHAPRHGEFAGDIGDGNAKASPGRFSMR